MSSTSPSPPLEILAPKKSKDKSSKNKQKPSTQTKLKHQPPSIQASIKKPRQGRNEGVDPTWAYNPPPGSHPLEMSTEGDPGDFDWDVVNADPNIGVWLIRVPDGVKLKQLQSIPMLDPPTSSSSSSSAVKLGTFERKHGAFNIWSMGVNHHAVGEADDEEQRKVHEGVEVIGAEELKSFTCLLPRKKKKGKLYIAPKPITRHIVISAQPVLPSLPSYGPEHGITALQRPPRESHPKELLKHRFMPYGSLGGTNEGGGSDDDGDGDGDTVATTRMDVDQPEGNDPSHPQLNTQPESEQEVGPSTKKSKTPKKSKSSHSKKRKGEEEPVVAGPPKKTKKVKMAAA